MAKLVALPLILALAACSSGGPEGTTGGTTAGTAGHLGSTTGGSTGGTTGGSTGGAGSTGVPTTGGASTTGGAPCIPAGVTCVFGDEACCGPNVCIYSTNYFLDSGVELTDGGGYACGGQ